MKGLFCIFVAGWCWATCVSKYESWRAYTLERVTLTSTDPAITKAAFAAAAQRDFWIYLVTAILLTGIGLWLYANKE